jgi:monoamine oxidase
VNLLGPGSLTEDRGAIWAPVGRIHWAGTETATYWHGYMDGAITSGKRAAQEVLSA